METTVTFRSLSALFRPEQCTTETHEFFGVSPEYDKKLSDCMLEASQRAFARAERLEDHATCVHSVMRDITALVDERCPPVSAVELAHVFYLAGMVTCIINSTVDDRRQKAALNRKSVSPGPKKGWNINGGVA